MASSSAVSAEKFRVRNAHLNRRRALARNLTEACGHAFARQVLSTREFQNARRIALFASFRNEPVTREIHRLARSFSKEVYYPRIHGKELVFHRTDDLRKLVPNRFGIPEPQFGNAATLGSIELIFVPGLAFDEMGRRIGYGAGFYDRLLHSKDRTQHTIGVCYDHELLSEIPEARFDVRVRKVLTPMRWVSA